MKLENLFPENWRRDTTSKQDEVSAKNLRDSFDKETADKLFGPERKKENFKVSEDVTETMAQRRERLKAEGLGPDSFGDSRGGYKVSGLKQTSNLPVRSTQLQRYQWSNQLAHQKTTDMMLADGRKIRFAGKKLEPGTEVFEIVSDGLDKIKEGDLSANGKFFHVRMGKVTAQAPTALAKQGPDPDEDLTVKPLEFVRETFHSATAIQLPADVTTRIKRLGGTKSMAFSKNRNTIVELHNGETLVFDEQGNEI